jgi:putative membrane protein
MMYGSGNLVRGGGNAMRGFNSGFMAYGHNGWLGLIPFACHLIFLIIIIVLVVLIMKRHGKKVREIQKQNDPALLVLRERYARGEIDAEEYNRRKQDLTN